MHAASGLESFRPTWFALVMATGILSIGCDLMGWSRVAVALFLFNLPAAALIWARSLQRLASLPGVCRADLSTVAHAPGYCAPAAAMCVLGVQALVMGRQRVVALICWVFGVGLLLTAAGALWAGRRGAGWGVVLRQIHGGWLLPGVATQAVCVLGAQLVPAFPAAARPLWALCLGAWTVGSLYYLAVSAAVARRLLWQRDRSVVEPPIWIAMGGAAISALAGSLLAAAPGLPPDHAAVLVLDVSAAALWLVATAWIPVLITAGAWRVVLHWSAIFPAGMYGVCTARVARIAGLSVLGPVARVVVGLALAAWCLTLVRPVWQAARR